MNTCYSCLQNFTPNFNGDCMFQINKLESALCKDSGHTTNNDGVCIDRSLHLENSSNVQTISWMLHQLMDGRGEYLENYRCVDRCQKLNTSTKAVYVMQLSDPLFIQLNIFKLNISNLSVDEEILVWGNRMVLSGTVYHEVRKQSHCRHYTSGVNVDNTWFLISDTRILRQQKLQCCSSDTSVPYIFIYKKRSNFMVAPADSLNGTAGVSSTSELISETAETMNQQSVLQEVEKQKTKLPMDQQKEKTISNKIKSPVKRKSKFTDRISRENDEKRKKFMRDNFGEDKKEQLKKR